MRFGIFDHLEKRGSDLGQLYRERLEYVRAADRAGFWCYHKAEHHMTPLDVAPSGNLLFAAIARETARIRFGALVYLLPFYHPLRLIEEICMLDQLSGGRIEVGVGRGISPPEQGYWGIDPERARAQSEEVIEILVKGLSSRVLDHEGEFFQFEKTPLELEPLQKPRPPLWYPGNVEFAAQHGMHTVMFGPPARIAEAADQYREIAAKQSLRKLNNGPPIIGGMRHIYVADDEASADARGRAAWARYTANLTKLWREAGLALPAMDPTVGGDFDRAREVRAVVVGTPERVAEDVAGFAELGCDYYIGAFSWGDLTHRESMASLARFAEAVMPRFSSA
jgi:alkanesulfonate monooxygenase SsuD/methylene tetrahydromethanopterin reductase-like flavin-dependent oxidoreductase (luciferase family)